MANFETKKIHTLNARGNIMLEVYRDVLSLSGSQMHTLIQTLRHRVEHALGAKGISYDRLRSALEPSQDRREIALIFDTTKINHDWYGFKVMERILPLLDLKSNHSVLEGDYLGRTGQSEKQYNAFKNAVRLRQDITYQHPSQFHVVYINNLTEAMFERLDKGLAGYSGYAGYADMTYGSEFKLFLSTMLANSFIKYGKAIIQGHEPDRPDNEDCNMKGYPFEKFGYRCRSINGDLMGVLLSYKIERPVYGGFEVDTEFSLNAIGVKVGDIDKLSVEVTDAKAEYLKESKIRSLEIAGLADIGATELAGMIKSKLRGNYIYGLSHIAEHNVTKFSIILEFSGSKTGSPKRLKAALAYEAEREVLRLLTMY